MPIKIKSTGGGSVTLDVPNTGSDFTLTAPANNATLFTTAGGTITGNVAFTSNNVTIGGNSISPFGGKNKIINGDMIISQRGTSFTGTNTWSNTYSLDRWATYSQHASISIEQSNDVPSNQGFSKSLKMTVTTANTSSSQLVSVMQRIEGQNIYDLIGGRTGIKEHTISFWFKTSVVTTYSLAARIFDGSNLASYPVDFTPTAANTWEKVVVTIPSTNLLTLPVTNTESYALIISPAIGSSNVQRGTPNTWTQLNYHGSTSSNINWPSTLGATFFITGVQLEEGSVATAFERRPFGQELQLCQRYYERIELDSEFMNTSVNSSYIMCSPFIFAARKRSRPTITTNITDANYSTHWGFAVAGWTVSVKSGTVNIGINSTVWGFGVLFTNATYSPVPTSMRTGWSGAMAAPIFEANIEL